MICWVEGCGEPVRTRGMCNRHYQGFWRSQRPKKKPHVFEHGAERNPNWRGGKAKHPLYHTYYAMLGRCGSEGNPRYHDYGGRGITVCQRWKADFWAFVGDMGERPAGFVLDRIDNDGNYEPRNCRWTDLQTSAKNKRRYGHEDRLRNGAGQFAGKRNY